MSLITHPLVIAAFALCAVASCLAALYLIADRWLSHEESRDQRLRFPRPNDAERLPRVHRRDVQ